MHSSIIYILFTLINIALAYRDSVIIKRKIVPNHFLNGLFYLLLCAAFVLFLHANIIALFCIRQLFFDTSLNLFRGRNFFYTSHYTSFYQHNNAFGSNSLIDKIENFFIDGLINIFNRRKWNWQPLIDMKVSTYNNYLNGKIQVIIYTIIFLCTTR